jgi:hypothetical protein
VRWQVVVADVGSAAAMSKNMVRLPCAFDSSAADVASASGFLEYLSTLQRGK